MVQIGDREVRGIIQQFQKLPDPRSRVNRRHLYFCSRKDYFGLPYFRRLTNANPQIPNRAQHSRASVAGSGTSAKGIFPGPAT
jgi:hypothetical protein